MMEMWASVMVGRHSIQNMTMTMTVDVIKKKYHCNNDLAATVNDAALCSLDSFFLEVPWDSFFLEVPWAEFGFTHSTRMQSIQPFREIDNVSYGSPVA